MTRFQIYTKMQYLLRQNSDINGAGDAGTVNGKTADLICWFVGPTLYSSAFFTPIAADLNDVVFIDDNGVERDLPLCVSRNAGIQCPAHLWRHRLLHHVLHHHAGRRRLRRGHGDHRQGQGRHRHHRHHQRRVDCLHLRLLDQHAGRILWATDRDVTLVWGNPGSAKPGVSTGTITQSKGSCRLGGG